MRRDEFHEAERIAALNRRPGRQRQPVQVPGEVNNTPAEVTDRIRRASQARGLEWTLSAKRTEVRQLQLVLADLREPGHREKYSQQLATAQAEMNQLEKSIADLRSDA